MTNILRQSMTNIITIPSNVSNTSISLCQEQFDIMHKESKAWSIQIFIRQKVNHFKTIILDIYWELAPLHG